MMLAKVPGTEEFDLLVGLSYHVRPEGDRRSASRKEQPTDRRHGWKASATSKNARYTTLPSGQSDVAVCNGLPDKAMPLAVLATEFSEGRTIVIAQTLTVLEGKEERDAFFYCRASRGFLVSGGELLSSRGQTREEFLELLELGGMLGLSNDAAAGEMEAYGDLAEQLTHVGEPIEDFLEIAAEHTVKWQRVRPIWPKIMTLAVIVGSIAGYFYSQYAQSVALETDIARLKQQQSLTAANQYHTALSEIRRAVKPDWLLETVRSTFNRFGPKAGQWDLRLVSCDKSECTVKWTSDAGGSLASYFASSGLSPTDVVILRDDKEILDNNQTPSADTFKADDVLEIMAIFPHQGAIGHSSDYVAPESIINSWSFCQELQKVRAGCEVEDPVQAVDDAVLSTVPDASIFKRSNWLLYGPVAVMESVIKLMNDPGVKGQRLQLQFNDGRYTWRMEGFYATL